MVWVYILQNPAGRFYIGQTDDLSTRLQNHNRLEKTAGKFSRKNGPWKLVWSEAHPTRAAALAREKQIKAMKSSAGFVNTCSVVESRRVGINRRVAGSSPASGAIFF